MAGGAPRTGRVRPPRSRCPWASGAARTATCTSSMAPREHCGSSGRDPLVPRPVSSCSPKPRFQVAAAVLHLREFWEQIYRLSAEGTTVLVTTHYMDEAERCHRLGFIFRGSVLDVGTP